jgi:hypothetical protein
MRLLKRNIDGDFSLTKDLLTNIPRYAILSHTWGEDGDEVTFEDLMDHTGKNKAGYAKIQFCGEQAAKDGLQHFWVDTCCINKSSSAELTEAINSMFRWYLGAAKCYVYLSDVSIRGYDGTDHRSPWQQAFLMSRWFTRGWTLQELIAPESVEFFSSEGQRLGDKRSMEQQVHEITGIDVQALRGSLLSDFSVAKRMSWAAKRKTTRKEDGAYCLLGIFDIHMPLIYGEGDNAFIRLKEEINKYSKGKLLALSQSSLLNRALSSTFFHSYANTTQPVSERLETVPTPTSTMPFRRNPDFVDRGSILSQIHERCSVPAARIALVGLGGVG